jgi:hypothetical protein
MARTYIPTMLDDVHEITVFLSKHNAVILAAITAIDPTAVAAYSAVVTALQALDALNSTLNPIKP